MGNLSDSRTGRRPAHPRQSAVGHVLDDLQRLIDDGEIRIGDRLPSEAALATRYDVSRSVIREVLRASAALGMTVTRTGKGTFVVHRRPAQLVFGKYTAADLLEVRPHIEIPAAGLAALRRTDDQLARLQGLVEQMEAETDPDKWTGLDSAFHLLLAEASGNAVFAEVVGAIRSALTAQSALLNRHLQHRRTESDAEHRSIAVAVARASSVEAEDAMSFHLDQVTDAVAASLSNPLRAVPLNLTLVRVTTPRPNR